MKKRWLIAAVLAGLLTACIIDLGFGDEYDGGDSEPKTGVVFFNTDGPCTAIVYNDPRRREEDKIVEVPAGGHSPVIEWSQGASVPFYFKYHVSLKGINGFSVDYVPDIGKDQTAVRIDANTITTINIPRLDEIVSSPKTPLSNKSHLVIDSSTSFYLQRGSTSITPDNVSNPSVNARKKAIYTIDPGSASAYHVLVSPDEKSFPAGLFFNEGYVYEFFLYNGNLYFDAQTAIILENVAHLKSE